MRLLQTVFCLGIFTWGGFAMAVGPTVQFAATRKQPTTEMPLREEQRPELVPPATDESTDAERAAAENVGPGKASTTNNPFDYGTMQGRGLPASPYIAGLSYMMTPQPFRVPYPDRFYYPLAHFVRRCPYYPKGVYWGADWNRRFLPPNNLIHGPFRFNPYLSSRKAHKHGAHGSHYGNHCMTVAARGAPAKVKQAQNAKPAAGPNSDDRAPRSTGPRNIVVRAQARLDVEQAQSAKPPSKAAND